MAESTNKRDSILLLLQITDVENSLAEFPEIMAPAFLSGLENSPNIDYSDPNQRGFIDAMKTTLISEYTIDNLTNAIVDELEDSLSAEHLQQTLDFYQSDFGKHATALKKESRKEIKSEIFRTFIREFPPKPIDNERLLLVEELLNSYESHTIMANMMIDSHIATLQGMMDEMPDEMIDKMYGNMDVADLIQTMQSQKGLMGNKMWENFKAHEYFSLRKLTTPQFRQYQEFETSPAGESFSKILLEKMANFTTSTLYYVGASGGKELAKLVFAESGDD